MTLLYLHASSAGAQSPVASAGVWRCTGSRFSAYAAAHKPNDVSTSTNGWTFACVQQGSVVEGFTASLSLLLVPGVLRPML